MQAKQIKSLQEGLTETLRLHLKAEATGSGAQIRSALEFYHITAKRAGLHPLPQSTQRVLLSQNHQPDQVRLELRALYMGILRVAHHDGSLEWTEFETKLREQLRKALRYTYASNILEYLVSPKTAHNRVRALLISRQDLLLPLILLSDSDETYNLLRRALKVNHTSTPAEAYFRIIEGLLVPTRMDNRPTETV